MINLASEDFDVQQRKVVFNNGKAGEVVCTLKVQKKSPEDKPNSPDYKIVLVDSNGAELNQAFYYLIEGDKNYENKLKAQGISLKHIIHNVYTPETNPPAVSTARELLDTAMVMIAGGAVGRKFKFLVTFGTVNRPNNKQYLGIKHFVPFMTADLEASIPYNPNFDLMERITPDTAPKEEDKAPW